jgi:hypothetical protein
MIHAFVSDGRLYLRTASGDLQEVESPFANEKRDRMERQKSAHGWQSSLDGTHFSSAVLWGKQASSSNAPFRFTDVVPAGDGSLYYTMHNGVVTGLFRYDLNDSFETRLFHKNGISIIGFDFSSGRNQLVVSTQEDDLRAHLELLDEKASHIRGLTSGDVVDSNPSFSHASPDRVVFQSSGVMRNDEGFVVCMGPSAIMTIDLNSEDLVEMYSDPHHDLMLPRQDAQGNLYCVRRPYKAPYSSSPLSTLLHVVLFPIRFCVAVVGFLNAFTELFSRPLMKAQGPQMQAPEREKYVRVLGETIQVAKLYRASYYGKEVSMVPRSWELIRVDKDRNVKVLAKNVAFYDVDAGGNVCFTNGFKVTNLSQDAAQSLFKHSLIERLRAVGPA